MTKQDQQLVDRYLAAYAKRGLRGVRRFTAAREAFQLVNAALFGAAAGNQRRAKQFQDERREGHRRAIARVGELGRKRSR